MPAMSSRLKYRDDPPATDGATAMSKSKTPLAAKQFAIVPILCDSLGARVIPTNAIAHGSLSAIAENIVDSRARDDSIAADAEIALLKRQHAAAQADAAQARSECDQARRELDELLGDELKRASDKLGTLAQRMDNLEKPDPEQLVYPPGYQAEDAEPDDPTYASPTGELHTIAAKTNGHADASHVPPQLDDPLPPLDLKEDD